MAKRAIPLPVPVIDPEDTDCPKCPPKGAPAWMATFADIATLLMAFFVLILSFAEFNQPRFKMVSGSLRDAFGIQREMPVMEMPRGTTTLSDSFSPSPEPAVIEELTQETTETESPEIETGDGGSDGIGSPGEAADAAQAEAEAEAMAEAIETALPPDSPLEATVEEGEVVLRFPPETSPEDLARTLSEAATALSQAAAQTGADADQVRIEGLGGQMETLAEMATAGSDSAEGNGDAARQALLAEAELRVALRQELGEGLVSIEQREDRVLVTVGAGGAFPSGDAELTAEAREIMSRIAFSAMGEASEITVTGHTDDVPLTAGSAYRDNWGLAAARASSVVRELQGSSLLEPERLTATSRGESAPLVANDTPENRARNRRIEIEITY